MESKGLPPPTTHHTTLMFVGWLLSLQCPSSRLSTSDSQELLIRKEFSRTSTKELLRSVYHTGEGLKYSNCISWLLPFGTQFNQMHLNYGHFMAVEWGLVDHVYNNDKLIDLLFWSVNLVLTTHPLPSPLAFSNPTPPCFSDIQIAYAKP